MGGAWSTRNTSDQMVSNVLWTLSRSINSWL